MHSFIDPFGRVWTVAVDDSALERIRQYGHDPAGLADGSLVKAFLSTQLRFVVFVYKLVTPQARAYGVDASAFWRMSSRCFNQMAAATLAALKDFNPNAGELAELELSKWQ